MPEVDPTPEQGTEQVTPPETGAAEPVVPAAEPEQPAVDPAPEPEAPAAPELPPIEERYRQQRSEALILNAQNKQKDEFIQKLTSQDSPTEAEILAEYPTFAQMDETSKKFVADLLTTKKRQARQDLERAQDNAERQWQTDLRNLTQDEKYKELRSDKGFEDFVFNPKHKGLDMTVLADAYLMRTGKTAPDETPIQQQPALPTGSAARGTGKKTKISIEEAAAIRKTDNKRYMELVKKGMIQDEF